MVGVVEPAGGFKNPDGSDWVPAFEGQRPPWQAGNEWAAKPGNQLAKGNKSTLSHGAYYSPVVEPLAERIIAATLADTSLEYLRSPRFAVGLRRWATSEARRQLIEQWVDSMPIEEAADSKRGQISPLELLRKWTVTAENSASKLGLDPVSASRIASFIGSTQKNLSAADLLTSMRKDAESKKRADG